MIRMGRMTALKKNTGGVRGIVAGDIVRRLVAKTIARRIRVQVEKATAPFQYALSTRAGCECIAHALQALSDADPEATILSVDGNQRVRLHFTRGDDAGSQTDGRGRRSRAVCEAVLWFSLHLHLGRRRKGLFTKCFREKEENKGTHSCQPCSLWGNTVRWRPSKPGCDPQSVSSRFWTTSTQYVHLVELRMCLPPSKNNSRPWASGFTMARRSCGTAVVQSQRERRL